MIELNEGQQAAADMIELWFTLGLEDKQTFVLTGYAGTGKTFLVNYIINERLKLKDDDVVYVAPTGKAASVLVQRGAKSAYTIHKLIYTRVEKEYTNEINGKKITSKKIEFIKKPSIKRYKLIVLDEVSMVENKVMKDLLSFGIPVLCCGDIGQLPAIGKPNDLLDNPDINLTEIVRQESNNAIVKLAEMARNGNTIRTGNYGNVIVINRDLITESQLKNILIKADQVLCGTNRTRQMLNKKIKGYLGFDTTIVNKGEKIICLLNNWEKELDEDGNYSLVNGIMGTAESTSVVDEDINLGMLSFKPDFLDDVCRDLVFDNKVFDSGSFRYEFHTNFYKMSDGSYKIKEPFKKQMNSEDHEEYCKRVKKYIFDKLNMVSEEQINFFDTAYAISVHKSQGSEWNNVVVFDESKYFEQPSKWLYTAITRAKKNLVIIK